MAEVAMAIVERHKSSSELPDLFVVVDGGDWVVGFDGYAWHTHVWRTNCKIRDLDVPVEHNVDPREVADDIRKYAPPGETAEIWYWNGQRSAIA
jgi:hypothetical protein